MKCLLSTTVKDFIDHYYNYLSVSMNPDVVVQLMISQQLLSEDVVITAQSCYHKNCLILEQVQLMDTKRLVSFCELLKGDQRVRKTGEMLLSGEHFKHIQNLIKCLWKTVRKSVFQRPFTLM